MDESLGKNLIQFYEEDNYRNSNHLHQMFFCFVF